MTNALTPGFTWIFHRIGGLDQVVFSSGEDVCRLGELDPKLWVALSCPAKGLEFDQRTLTLIDTDKDGRIRIPEIIDAGEWTCMRLKDPGALLNPGSCLPLAAIDDSTEVGQRLVSTGRAILAQQGHEDALGLTQDDVTQAVLHASEQMFNGDGILPPQEGVPEELRGFIVDAMAVTGGVTDVGGGEGINTEIADAFMQTLAQWRDWNDSVAKAESPLGKATPEAWQLLTEVKDKINDYFMRCELAAYAPSAQDQLNLEDKPLTDETGLLEQKTLAELPLSKAGPDKPLDLTAGLNPAWRERLERLGKLVKPLLADSTRVTRDDWQNVQKQFEPYADAVRKKPEPVAAPGVTVAPMKQVEDLGVDRIDELLEETLAEQFRAMAADDANGPAASTDIADMERLVLYYLHLHRLLINFVSFQEFYDTERTAAFQSGSLYIDGRSCHLCMPAGDVEAHSSLAKSSQLFLLYCACSRGKKAGESGPEKTMNIVAAVTAGDADLLTQGRNGVFVDNQGNDWDATVVKVVSNPISVWQAVWTPYKRIGNLITEQISKYANEKQAGLMQSAGQKLDEVSSGVMSGAAPKFDISRNVGMFAAVGLALGAIGTAVGSIFNALLSMAWWQLPLVVAGVFTLVSGPSVLMAWLMERQRTLGPLLEASGWAINGRAALSYGVAKRLSSTAEMPANSKRSNLDPVVQMKRLRRNVFWVAVVVGIVGALGVLVWREYREELLAGRLQAATAPATLPAASEPVASEVTVAPAPAAEAPVAAPPAEEPAAAEETPPEAAS